MQDLEAHLQHSKSTKTWRNGQDRDSYWEWPSIFSREECSNKGGTNSGSCAEGFGVCCTCKLHSYFNDVNFADVLWFQLRLDVEAHPVKIIPTSTVPQLQQLVPVVQKFAPNHQAFVKSAWILIGKRKHYFAPHRGRQFEFWGRHYVLGACKKEVVISMSFFEIGLKPHGLTWMGLNIRHIMCSVSRSQNSKTVARNKVSFQFHHHGTLNANYHGIRHLGW